MILMNIIRMKNELSILLISITIESLLGLSVGIYY